MTPGITALEYAQRRSKLANKLPKNGIAVLAASEVKYRASGIFNEYRQDSNFFYLTGMCVRVCGRKDRRGGDTDACLARIQRAQRLGCDW